MLNSFFYHGTIGKNLYGVYFLLYIYICVQKVSTKAQITSRGGEEEEHKPEDNIHKHQETKVASQSKRA
jgi:hypothetical protein